MPPLTKSELDASTEEFAAWRHATAPETKSVSVPQTRNVGLIKAVTSAVAPHIIALEKQVAALQTRVAELEASSLKYCGVYQPSASYPRGSCVSFDGSAWHATRAVTSERPGSSDGWQLMVKHGKDAPSANPRSDTSTAIPRKP